MAGNAQTRRAVITPELLEMLRAAFPVRVGGKAHSHEYYIHMAGQASVLEFIEAALERQKKEGTINV